MSTPSWHGLTFLSNVPIRWLGFPLDLIHNTHTGSTSSPPFDFRPVDSYLHRQTVFYTPSTIPVSAGEKITGKVTCAPNARNNRDLDITINYKPESQDEEVEIRYKMCVSWPLSEHVCHFSSIFRADQRSGLELLCCPCMASKLCCQLINPTHLTLGACGFLTVILDVGAIGTERTIWLILPWSSRDLLLSSVRSPFCCNHSWYKYITDHYDQDPESISIHLSLLP